jgi:hypothetical protein
VIVVAALALQAAPLPRPPIEAIGQVIYWTQCVSYGAQDRARGNDRPAGEIVERQFQSCRDHERRVQAELLAHQPEHAAAHMQDFRDMVRRQAVSAVERQRQPAPAPAPAGNQ